MKICAVGILFLGLLGWGIHRETIIQEQTLQQQITTACSVFRAKTVPIDAKTEATLRTVCLEA